MICPKCYNTENKTGDYYCHNCGYQFKKKNNSWAIFFAVLFVIAGIFAIYYYNEFESQKYRINNLESENNNIRSESDNKAEEYQTKINSLTNEISRQNTEIENKNTEISNLKAQTYYTRYSNQYLYNKCGGKYEKANCYFPSIRTTVYIYKQEDGYGLTSIGGWIPMYCLEKY